MRTKYYSCPNGCKLPRRKKVLQEKDNHLYGFDYDDFSYCPVCGSMMPYTKKKIKDFFEVYHIHSKLQNAERLILISEYNSAVREAAVVLETELRSKSGLDLHGFELATKALGYEYDKKTNEIKKQPLIAINGLATESERNEQEGFRYMLMGFFLGIRNLYQHNQIGSGVSDSLTALLEVSFFLSILNGHSLTKHGRWIAAKMNYHDIYRYLPKRLDRIKLRYMLKIKKYTWENNQGTDKLGTTGLKNTEKTEI